MLQEHVLPPTWHSFCHFLVRSVSRLHNCCVYVISCQFSAFSAAFYVLLVRCLSVCVHFGSFIAVVCQLDAISVFKIHFSFSKG